MNLFQNFKPKKSLSQNFLIDNNIVNKIIKAAAIMPEDTVLEIGPGFGALTKVLLQTGARVIAIEKDKTLAKRFNYIEADFLEFDLNTLPKGKLKVVSNLPYGTATPIMGKLLTSTLFSTLTLMLQKEVAKRCLSKPNSKDYSAFTLFINFFSTPKYLFEISENCFYPKPKVKSACLNFILKKPPFEENQEQFFSLIKRAFCHRRKMLTTSLKDLGNIRETLKALNIPETARPENLSLEEFMALHQKLLH